MNKTIEEWKRVFGGMETPLEHFKRVFVSREAEAEQQQEYDRKNKEWEERRKEVIGKSISALSKHRLGNSRKER